MVERPFSKQFVLELYSSNRFTVNEKKTKTDLYETHGANFLQTIVQLLISEQSTLCTPLYKCVQTFIIVWRVNFAHIYACF